MYIFLLVFAFTSQIAPFIEGEKTPIQHEEVGYRPLGRSVIVDTLLANPFYLPTYAVDTSNSLRQATTITSLAHTVFKAGGMPKLPDTHINADNLYDLWRAFIQVYRESEEVYSVLSDDEKKWLREHYNEFFFGENSDEYDFFTTTSEKPLLFFKIASKLDFIKLAECSLKLAAIVDYVHEHAQEFPELQDDLVIHEEGLTFIVTSSEGATFHEDADFFLSLKGNNSFYNNAGGTRGTKYASLHIALGGNNSYYGQNFVQGSGFLGIGMLANFGGGNSYKASTYAQGSSLFGMGFLINMGGHNTYELDFAGQSFALFGTSCLVNRGGYSTYIAHEGMAQAASSTMGIAFLVDHTGNSNYTAGKSDSAWTRYCGIGQGASIGVRHDAWEVNPSFYGGVAFLYTGGGHNSYKNSWFSQGSSYFLSAGILVDDGVGSTFTADVDSQGQGLHLGIGLLLKRGTGSSHFSGGWGSQGVGADRSVGMLLAQGENNSFEVTEQGMGSSRKPHAIGLFIDEAVSTYSSQKDSCGYIQLPYKPWEWPYALFLPNTRIPYELFAQKPEQAFSPEYTFRPLTQNIDDLETADYDKRRYLYECIDLYDLAVTSTPETPLLLTDSSPTNRAKASENIAKSGSTLIYDALTSSDEVVKYAAAFALIGSARYELLPNLQALYTDSSFYVRKAASLAALSLGDKEALPILYETLQYPTLDTTENYGDNVYALIDKYAPSQR